MISPSDYDRLCDQLTVLYDDLDNAIISDITRRILKTGRITESAKWQIKQLQESGMLYDDILAEIASRTDATRNHVRTLFEDAGVQSIRNDNRFYRAAGLEGIVKMSDAALQTLNAGYLKCNGDLQNLTLTTAVTSQQAYINACNQAYMQITSGAFDYNTAIRNAIKSAAVEGTHVLYPSGHRDRVDVAVRRAVLTGVGQTVRKLSVINAEDMGCDIMEITAHSGARPSHAEWQGKLVSLSGKNAGKIINGCRVLSLGEIGYGSGDGFGGWNCRHDWYPFFEGISERAYSDKRLKELDARNIEYNGRKYTEYEISQIQRRYEREIRAAKREQTAFRTAVEEADNPELKQVMQDSLNYANSVVKDKQAKMRDFIRQTGQFRDYSREQNYGRVAYPKNSENGLTNIAKGGKINSKNPLVYVKSKVADIKNKLKDTFTPEKHKEVSQEYLDNLPKLSKPESISQALKATNPNKYTENCQRCVPAYEMRRRGYNVIALDAPEGDIMGLYEFRNIFSNAEWVECNGGGKNEIIEFLSSCEDNTRLEVSIVTNEGSHVFCAEKVNNKVIFTDPQTGEINVDRYFKKTFMENTKFCRIDNLEFNNLIKECIEEGG